MMLFRYLLLRYGPATAVDACLVSLVLACCPALAQSTQHRLPPAVADALRQAAIPDTAVGTYVQEVDSGRVLLAVNNATPFNPASTMKLVTSAAALDLLGPTYTWKTRAFADGTRSEDVLQGNLIFKGTGDPKLVLENFWMFLRQIRAAGLREVRGNVVLDRTTFVNDEHDPAKFDGDPTKPYNAGPDALLLNFAVLRLHFMPDPSGGASRVTLDPPLAGVTLGQPQPSNEECGAWQSKLHLTVTPTRIAFEGRMPTACGEKTWDFHPDGMTRNDYFGAVFRQLWRDLGGTFTGDVIDGVLPPQARLVAEHESASLPEVMRDMNKFSNNVMARQLLLTIAAEAQKAPGATEPGAHLVKTWLAAKGVENPEVVIENGAGLSRIARISAGTMGRMLMVAYHAPTMPEFVSSLPLVGFDGTMRGRLQDRTVAGNAHVKTGSLHDVQAIAGYVQAGSGRHYAVVSLINHSNAAQGRHAHDLLLQWIYDRG